MAKTIKPSDLADALSEELTLYHEDVLERIDEAGGQAVKKLVQLTKSSAPEGVRKSYKRHIACKRLSRDANGSVHVWYVKPPDHRLTHLLAHGHATKDGGRTRANPFLSKALNTVLPEYEKAVEEAVQND